MTDQVGPAPHEEPTEEDQRWLIVSGKNPKQIESGGHAKRLRISLRSTADPPSRRCGRQNLRRSNPEAESKKSVPREIHIRSYFIFAT